MTPSFLGVLAVVVRNINIVSVVQAVTENVSIRELIDEHGVPLLLFACSRQRFVS